MANPEHMKILKQGVEAWNKWRDENPDIQPDLSKIHTSLSYPGINFSGVNLSHAIFDIGFFFQADFSNANLHKASIHGGLRYTNFHNAILLDAMLNHADIRDSNMEKAYLENADLRYCLLTNADLTEAVLTGTRLYGTARDDWIIKDAECKYVYWDIQGTERCPKNRDLEPGEFERLYAAMPTIEYVFNEGFTPLDPVIMDRIVVAIRDKHPEFDIKIDSINARGLAPSIKFTVQHEDHKEPALEEVQTLYEEKIKQLESERDRYYDLVAHALDRPRDVKLINAAPGSIVATDGSSIHIEQHIHKAIELQKAIAAEPQTSESFGKLAKKKALDIIGGAIEDIAKGQVKEAAKLILELGKNLGPVIAKTAAFAFFKGLL